jgi:BASS family bile acid:Na+ symporter
MTPLLAKLLVGSSVEVSGWALCGATAKVVLFPVLLGMLLKARAPALTKAASRFTPFASVLLVSLICGGVVAQTAPLLSAGIVGSTVGLPLVLSSVVLLHLIGFAAGYIFPKLLSTPEKGARTISIEVGMQNSALAVVLARSIPGVHPAASLPGALSATAHSCLGSMLAAFWRLQASRGNSKKHRDV